MPQEAALGIAALAILAHSQFRKTAGGDCERSSSGGERLNARTSGRLVEQPRLDWRVRHFKDLHHREVSLEAGGGSPR